MRSGGACASVIPGAHKRYDKTLCFSPNVLMEFLWALNLKNLAVS